MTTKEVSTQDKSDPAVSVFVDRMRESLVNSTITPLYNSSQHQSDYLLGELLLELRILSRELVDDALESSYELGVPIGRVLVMSGWMTERQLDMAVQLQSLINEGALSLQSAHRICDLMTDPQVSLEEALGCLGVQRSKPRSNRLGELLTLSGLVETFEVEEAVARARALGLPFGRCMVLAGVVSPSLLEAAINAQRFVRQKKMSREEAVAALKATGERMARSSEALCGDNHCYQQPPMRSIRLGELLVLAGIVTEAQVQYAVELGLLHNVALGHLLLDAGLLSSGSLENALLLQKMVCNGSIGPLEAVYALIDIHYHGYSLARALSEADREEGSGPKSIEFSEFLVNSGIASKRVIRESIEAAYRNAQMVGKAMLLNGAIDENRLQLALRCHFYIKEGMLSFEEGVVAFDHSMRTGQTVEDTMEQLGLELRKQQQESESEVAVKIA